LCITLSRTIRGEIPGEGKEKLGGGGEKRGGKEDEVIVNFNYPDFSKGKKEGEGGGKEKGFYGREGKEDGRI